MTGVAVIDVYDSTHANISHLPAGQPAAGYSTGSGPVPWTAADWAAHPGAVRIDQSPINTPADETSDEIDYEDGAATLADLPAWCFAAWKSYRAVTRAGQRKPAVYMSSSNVTAVVNALIAGGVTSGIGLHIAHYGIGRAAAIAMIQDTSGPWPVIGVQYDSGPYYDRNVYSQEWLTTVSGKAPTVAHPAAPAPPPGQWSKPAVLVGPGLDGNTWTTTYDPATGQWSPPVKAP